ncbi:conserved hypothetical protein [Solidesulfovibrio fructosivorans JJ]]|uniref:AlgX/AlgJ SGNH hydrolase-like domain-containing protein n=2 Tax=Solidesulfovibrio fructosivorans TaxID=878 RepID=E1JWN6_SOLFR|nr:conserved hypothetical protein [Solidesulfovibrio fructosivorans JJ]]
MTFSRRTVAFLSCFLFVALLALPTVDRVFKFAPMTIIGEAGGGKLTELKLDPGTWVPWFNKLRHGYLEHHYSLRGLLITWESYLDTFVLASTSTSSQVVAGKDHWLFLAQDGARNILEDARSPYGLPKEAVALIAQEMERRREWLAARGIKYLVIVAPNKNTVYPEKLPDALRPVFQDTHLDRFVAYVKARTKVDIVNVTQALMEAKKKEQVFYSTDSHWNANGAFAAYEAIVPHLVKDFPAITPLTRSQFSVERFNWLPGDLANMMGLGGHLKEDRIMFVNKDWYKARGATYDGPMPAPYFETPQYSYTGDPKLPNALVFHDSFWWELLPFMAESFDKGLYVWLKPQTETEFRYFDTALIEKEKPDLVIDEYTERYILPTINGHFRIKSDAVAKAP